MKWITLSLNIFSSILSMQFLCRIDIAQTCDIDASTLWNYCFIQFRMERFVCEESAPFGESLMHSEATFFIIPSRWDPIWKYNGLGMSLLVNSHWSQTYQPFLLIDFSLFSIYSILNERSILLSFSTLQVSTSNAIFTWEGQLSSGLLESIACNYQSILSASCCWQRIIVHINIP
jgi:hypothetical protein